MAGLTAHAHNVGDNHAPILEQCRLDFTFWKGDVVGATDTNQTKFNAKLNLHSDDELMKRVIEMSGCAIIATESESRMTTRTSRPCISSVTSGGYGTFQTQWPV